MHLSVLFMLIIFHALFISVRAIPSPKGAKTDADCGDGGGGAKQKGFGHNAAPSGTKSQGGDEIETLEGEGEVEPAAGAQFEAKRANLGDILLEDPPSDAQGFMDVPDFEILDLDSEYDISVDYDDETDDDETDDDETDDDETDDDVVPSMTRSGRNSGGDQLGNEFSGGGQLGNGFSDGTEKVDRSGNPSEIGAEGILDYHNEVRALHGADVLTWDDTLASSAQSYASLCQWGHSNGPYGENLAVYSDGTDPQLQAAQDWYAEEADYNYQTGTGAAGAVVGHFTQMVWQESSSIGCATAVCDGQQMMGWNTPNAHYVVCHYDPPGNVVGQYIGNVQQPTN